MKRPVFITGIGTGVGKTVVAAIVTEALGAHYWKPVQAGSDDTDAVAVQRMISNSRTIIHPELYKLQLPASPHIAAREEGITIELQQIKDRCTQILSHHAFADHPLIIEGAGGIMVPLNEREFTGDLIEKLGAGVILVSRNYLGSINHSLLTAAYCRAKGLPVIGWIFNDQYLAYEQEIVEWSGYPLLGSVPFADKPDAAFVKEQAERLKATLDRYLYTPVNY